MKIKNINALSVPDCSCRSGLAHWYNFSKQKSILCSEINCYEVAVHGTHVRKSGSDDNTWYIVPLCNKHNMCTGEIEISDSVVLVPSGHGECCTNKNSEVSADSQEHIS